MVTSKLAALCFFVVIITEVGFRRLVSLIYLNFEQTVYRSFQLQITKQPTAIRESLSTHMQTDFQKSSVCK